MAKERIEVVDHIMVPYSEEVMKILFKKETKSEYKISYQDKYLATQHMSKSLIKELSSKGFKFTPANSTRITPKRDFNGIKVTINKNYEGKQCKELVISVPSASVDESREKRSLITSALNELVPDVKFEPLSERLSDCGDDE